jgi:hypothetical protein
LLHAFDRKWCHNTLALMFDPRLKTYNWSPHI